ncbi:hypothetical protein P43SY_000572 [Pythium insidiosum]|uniref:DUF2428 domain-containing protein n=1 Tax=Pythium insidiosum TaxID=114742 RepID=A0AAD5LAB7_PYTIN|nr:hypothetical protein P43SY_000572 [Pythium insidiosum]
MVRKKRKGLVKDAHSGADAATAAVPFADVVAHAPLNATLVFAGETDLGLTSYADLHAWYTALCTAPTRFEQLKLLQLFRAGCKKLPTYSAQADAVAALTEATWRLLFRVYGAFSPSLAGVQKNVSLVLQELAISGQASDRLEAIARDELRSVLDAALKAPDGDIATSVQVLSQLQTMMEFPFLLRVIVRDNETSSSLARVIAAIADHLDVLVQPIAAFQGVESTDGDNADHADDDATDTTTTNTVLLASERCSHALKSVIVLASLKDELTAALRVDEQKKTTTTLDLQRLVDHCGLILSTHVVHKDLLTQTGLAYCLLRRLVLQLQSANDATVNGVDWATRQLFEELFDAKSTSPFGVFARLALLRGFLNSLSDDQLVVPVIAMRPDEENAKRSLCDFVFGVVHASCLDESLNARLYAFQVLEAFLRRVVSSSLPPLMASTIASLTSAVLLNWENPSKRVNQFMHLMFTHIVSYQERHESATELAVWKENVVARLIQLPTHSRARYGGLSILSTPYGARALLQRHPTLLPSILHAVGIKDVSAAAAGLFTQLLDELSRDGEAMTPEALRSVWLEDVAAVLLSADAKLRASVAMYALPLLLKKDPDCVPSLLESLRAQHAAAKSATSSDSKDVLLWAIIEVLKFARRKIAPERLLGLPMTEIQHGLENARPEARGAAFEALCASLKSTTLPTPEEVNLLQRFLVVSAKEMTASTRMNSLNSLKTVFFRIKEFLRIQTKGNSALQRLPEAQRRQQQQELADEVARAQALQRWIELFIVTSVYPGALVQRSIIGLEVLLLYVQVFHLDDSELLRTPHMVTTLLNMLIGSWDVIRALANTILDLYPADLPGFTRPDELEMLWRWALTLCVSPRQRESDAGAHFMQLLYRRSASLAAQNVAELPSTQHATGLPLTEPSTRFVVKLTDLIDERLNASMDLSKGESPLVHGLLLSLRYIIDSTSFKANDQDATAAEWKYALHRVFSCVQRALQLSLAVVGDATSGVGDEKLSATFEAGVVGEVSAAGGKTAAIPLRVDCRGHLILEDGATATEEEAADTEQRAVVGSWLAARECGAILNTLLRRVPLPTGDAATDLFPAELAQAGGEMLLNSLFELKHKGAVATAYESFEGICKSLLAHGERNAMLGRLPSVWAERLLERLERSEQQFILRRSSGFAYSFVAILRAEPRNTAALILPRVMSNLLRLASQDTDALALTHQNHLAWRSRVHALNILKLISQDAVLADDVAVYVSSMLEHAIFGFECRSWVVRNSSMMLFAAATQRALGDKRIADGASKHKVPSAEVFSRFPQLDSFLFRALQRFTQPTEDGVPPPGLYPVLMFLSRLRPTDDDEDDELRARGNKPLADFVPLVMQCASQSVLPIRFMAAEVLGAIVRPHQAVDVLRELKNSLPQGVRASASQSSSPDRRRISTNEVHGTLLQAKAVINKCLSLAAINEQQPKQMHELKMVLAFVMQEFVPSCEWLATDRVKCFAIRGLVLEIVEAVVKYRTTNATDDSLLSPTMMSLCTREVDRLVTTASVSHAPGEYKYNRALVGIFFGLVWEQRKELNDESFARVIRLLESPVLEARKRAFKQLGRMTSTPGGWDLTQETAKTSAIQAVLLRRLLVEQHPTVKTRLLHLLVATQHAMPSTSALDTETRATTMRAIQELLTTSADVDVLGPSLTLLAAFVRDGASDITTLTVLKDSVSARAAESQPLGLRHAAATAIARSNLLLASQNTSNAELVAIAVDAWMVSIKLLQDDDSSVRDVIRRAVYEALVATHSISKGLHESASETAMLPAAIHFVIHHFAFSSEYGLNVVREFLLSLVDAPTVLVEYTVGAKAQDWGDLCNRIFEAEANNFYAEPELLAHHVIAALFQSESPVSLEPLKTSILEKTVETLTLLNDHRARQQWLGGITYYSSVFPTLFSLLCASVAVLASETRGLSELRAAVQTQATTAATHLGAVHPLVVRAIQILSNGHATTEDVAELLCLSPSWKAIN